MAAGNKVYRVDPAVSKVLLIGCGGTGAALAELLCRMNAGFGIGFELICMDGDRVEEANVIRQQFMPWEIGKNKAEALSLRLAGQFGVSVSSIASPFDKEAYIPIAALVITATDSLASRRLVARRNGLLWLDVGNELACGQAVLGTTGDGVELGKIWRRWNRTNETSVPELPNESVINPVFWTARKRSPKASRTRGCATAPYAKQGFGVNGFAAHAAALLAKQVLVDKCIRTAAVYFNLTTGWMRPRKIDRSWFEPWKNVVGRKKS